LTEAKITLVDNVDWQGRKSDRVLELARVNSHCQTGIRSPLDEAILAGRSSGPEWERRAELPFDFSRRCLSVLASRENEMLLVTKGAPEAVLSRAVAVEVDNLAHPLDETWRARLEEEQQRLNEQGFRLIGVAIRSVPADQTGLTLADEASLTFVGFCVFADPPKPDAAKAVADLAALGVTLKVISGDQAAVVQHVAQTVGLAHESILTGAEITELTDAGLAARVEQVDLFARVDPDQKKRIIDALRKHGHVTGFLGDGINDAPAIHAAHVGLSVEGATDVARAAADMILLASDLNVLAEGVREGRRTFANILKYVRMGTSSNFGNMLSMALASIVLPFLPLLPLQILLNNLLYDLSEIGIPFDSVDADALHDRDGHRHRPGVIPDRMVSGVDRNADSSHLLDSNPASAVACYPRTHGLDGYFGRSPCGRAFPRNWTTAIFVWVRAAFLAPDRRTGRRDGGLSGGRGSRQAVRASRLLTA
jgi:Mg2+-importing ATPase